MPSTEITRFGFIKQQKTRVFEKVSIKGVPYWLDRKFVTSDLVREPKPLQRELPQDAVSPIAERSQGMAKSFRNSRIGKSLGISTLKEAK